MAFSVPKPGASGRSVGAARTVAGAGDGRKMLSGAVVAVPVASGRRVRSKRASRPRMLFCTRRSTDCWRSGVDSAAAEGDRRGVRVSERSRESGWGWC